MEATGAFSEEMKNFFDAEDGAYTSFTEIELQKGTYNVKSVIRKLLIDNMGIENIPVVNVTPSQGITFNICPKAKIYEKETLYIPCKFSKKDKYEMTIYFSHELIQILNAAAGDIWYIYFQNHSTSPVLGVISNEKWVNLFEEVESDVIREPDEQGSHILTYSGQVSDMDLIEVATPERESVQRIQMDTTVKSISAEEAARREQNRKNKGNRGEEIVIEIEKRRLNKLGRNDLLSKITHVAKYKDGLGYDIISTDVDENGNESEIYIEVKATAGDVNMPFYVSAHELEVSQKYRELYYIYRIFGLKEKDNKAQYYRLKGAIDENFKLIAADYLAYRNNQ